MKVLAGSTWGKDKETLTTTYKSIGRPIANYGAPIFTPQLCNTNWQKLQTTQNASLRIITGCHKMSNVDHLHQETKVLPIKDHSKMLAVQYALKCHHPTHPNFELTRDPDPPRNIRKSALVKYRDCINHLPPPTSQRRLKRGTKLLHTSIVSGAIRNLEVNRVLRTRPPKINPEEKSLPRVTRSALAQLRSGWCNRLNSYKARIDPTEPDICPDCGNSPHDVKHLFNCPRNPTTLREIDLWKKPALVAEFLDLSNDDENEIE